MNENAKKWLKALRSGKYNQTRGHLRDSNGYCCLGVACDIYAKESGEDIEWEEANHIDNPIAAEAAIVYQIGFKTGTLPAEVKNWLGLNSETGYIFDPEEEWDEEISLTELNDEKKFSFDQIADFVEMYWKQLSQKEA